MASSRLHQLKIIDSIVGNEIGSMLLNKIELDYGNVIRKHSDSTLRGITYGVANYGDTLIELREATPDSNQSHIVIVYNNSTGLIKQIKGVGEKLPEAIYYDEIYNFYINSPYIIAGHKWEWKEYLDFKPEMFGVDKYTLIKSKIVNKIF
jgi:hypothetical protein